LCNPDVHEGDSVKMFAKIKNTGRGSTPHKITITASWQIDGKQVGWSASSKPLLPGEEVTLTSNAGGPHSGKWTAIQGNHVLKCVLDDIDRLPGENKANNACDKTITVGANIAGELSGSSQAAPGSVNLSEEGEQDWVHWGLANKNQINRKANANLIDSDLLQEGKGYCDSTSGCPVAISWRNGTPVAQENRNYAGLWWNGVGTAQTFTVPADTTERVLKIYVSGIEGAGCKLTAKLSDDSAPAYVSKWNGNAAFDWAAVPDAFSAVYTIRYRAASMAQKLSIEWRLVSEPNQFLGQARLQAATLASAKPQRIEN